MYQKFPWAAPSSSHPSPGLLLVNDWFVFWPESFAFSRMSYNWNYIVLLFWVWFLSLCKMHLRFLFVGAWARTSFLLIAVQDSPTQRCMGCLCTCSKRTLRCFHFGAIMNNAAIKFMYRFCVNVSFRYSWVHPWVELLGCVVSICLILLETAKLIYRVAIAFSKRTSDTEELQESSDHTGCSQVFFCLISFASLIGI